VEPSGTRVAASEPQSVKFIDAIRVDSGARAAEGSFFVDPGDDYLKDHFPGAPMLPGLLMLEAAVRTAAALWAASGPPSVAAAVLEHVDRLQVVRRVVPGKTLRVHVDIEADPGGDQTARFTARGAVDGETVVRARFRLRAVAQEVSR
jgi:3-hydroxyacyl-[acyl-carrier-protein] dehydratase